MAARGLARAPHKRLDIVPGYSIWRFLDQAKETKEHAPVEAIGLDTVATFIDIL